MSNLARFSGAYCGAEENAPRVAAHRRDPARFDLRVRLPAASTEAVDDAICEAFKRARGGEES